MNKKFSLRNAESIDLGTACAGGFVSCSVVRSIDGRPTEVYLWGEDGNGFLFSSEPTDIAARSEVGIIGVVGADRRKTPRHVAEERLPAAFLSPMAAFIVQAENDGVTFDSGVYFLAKTGAEILITSANYPHALAIKFAERTKDYEPEFFPPDCQYVEVECNS